LCWAEILCTVPSVRQSKKSTQHRWVHVDPVRQLVHRPDLVESIFGAIARADLSTETSLTVKPPANSRNKYVAGRENRSLPASLSRQRRLPLPYAVAVEHADTELYHVTDVTPRYASSWLASLRRRSGSGYGSRGAKQNVNGAWWVSTLEWINDGDRVTVSPPQSIAGGTSASDAIVLADDDDEDSGTDQVRQRPKGETPHVAHLFDADEATELERTTRALSEAIPTTKTAFVTHPAYALASVLGKTQVLHPEAKSRVCGVFKGEVIYRRSDVSVARTAKKWLYEGRRVREDELDKPVKQTKARKKAVSKTNDFQPLASYGVGVGNDGSEEQQLSEIAKGSTPLLLDDEDDQLQKLYGVWQTDPWSPPTIGPDDPIPVHETYRTIELALLNPGLVHIDQRGMAPIAKQLGIPYAPCHVGFEGRGGKRAPEIRGIVVHEHNSQLLREAGVEVISRTMQQEYDSQRDAVYKLWKRLMRGLLVKDRLERDYGDSA
jgi:xeroderma pigmentosum group C-complementing protein